MSITQGYTQGFGLVSQHLQNEKSNRLREEQLEREKEQTQYQRDRQSRMDDLRMDKYEWERDRQENNDALKLEQHEWDRQEKEREERLRNLNGLYQSVSGMDGNIDPSNYESILADSPAYQRWMEQTKTHPRKFIDPKSRPYVEEAIGSFGDAVAAIQSGDSTPVEALNSDEALRGFNTIFGEEIKNRMGEIAMIGQGPAKITNKTITGVYPDEEGRGVMFNLTVEAEDANGENFTYEAPMTAGHSASDEYVADIPLEMIMDRVEGHAEMLDATEGMTPEQFETMVKSEIARAGGDLEDLNSSGEWEKLNESTLYDPTTGETMSTGTGGLPVGAPGTEVPKSAWATVRADHKRRYGLSEEERLAIFKKHNNNVEAAMAEIAKIQADTPTLREFALQVYNMDPATGMFVGGAQPNGTGQGTGGQNGTGQGTGGQNGTGQGTGGQNGTGQGTGGQNGTGQGTGVQPGTGLGGAGQGTGVQAGAGQNPVQGGNAGAAGGLLDEVRPPLGHYNDAIAAETASILSGEVRPVMPGKGFLTERNDPEAWREAAEEGVAAREWVDQFTRPTQAVAERALPGYAWGNSLAGRGLQVIAQPFEGKNIFDIEENMENWNSQMGYGSHFANALLNPDEVENRSFFEIDQALRNNKWPSASVVEEAKQLVSENPSIVDERMTPTQAETISMLIKKLENGELDG